MLHTFLARVPLCAWWRLLGIEDSGLLGCLLASLPLVEDSLICAQAEGSQLDIAPRSPKVHSFSRALVQVPHATISEEDGADSSTFNPPESSLINFRNEH